MRGAIIGDIVGSIYEFDNIKTKDFPLFGEGCFFTDDTVMTCAVAHAAQMLDGMRDHGELDYDAFQDKCNKNYHLLGAEYPDRGYGSHFLDWIYDIDAPAYNSCGNGSAMRVSPVAWIARNEEECLELAKRTALPSHDHPDGIAGACATALAVYLARMGRSKDDIRDAVSDYYDLSFTLDEIRPDYDWGALCSDTVPQAVVAFLESTSFEDAIRNAEAEKWRKSDPQKKQRSDGMAAQLEHLIEELDGDIAAAEASGDAKKLAELQDAKSAREAWLAQVTKDL